MKKTWQTEWPKTVGEWWFYGWQYGDKQSPPRLHLVRVRKIQNGFMIVGDGRFWYESEGAIGKWMKADMPKLPDLE